MHVCVCVCVCVCVAAPGPARGGPCAEERRADVYVIGASEQGEDETSRVAEEQAQILIVVFFAVALYSKHVGY